MGQTTEAFYLDGTPGSGKTAVLRQLEMKSLTVVEEAATDFILLWHAQGIAEPWMLPNFIDAVDLPLLKPEA